MASFLTGMPVSKLAKWKTTAQIFALCFLLGGPAVADQFDATLIGQILLWLAGVLTVWTGYDYLRLGLKHMMKDSA